MKHNYSEDVLREYDKVFNKYGLGRDLFTGRVLSREYRM